MKQEFVDSEQLSSSAAYQIGTSELQLSEMEMMLHNTPASDSVLEDLIMYNDLTRHVVSVPTRIPDLIDEYPEIRDDILVSGKILSHDRFIEMFLERNPEGFDKYLEPFK